MQLNIYENEGFELNQPDYEFAGLEFIGTCGSFPEQYDVVYPYKGNRYQVGYVRLRAGKLICTYPDVCGKEVYSKYWTEKPNKGYFDDEDERVLHLQLIALEIADKLIPRITL